MRTIGVLGGGQLSQMLIEASGRIPARLIPLCESAEDPAPRSAAHWVKGHWSKPNDIKRLLKEVEAVTFENEFIDVNLLRPYFTKHSVHPSLDAIYVLQNKLRQKIFLNKIGIPTAGYDKWKGTGDWRQWIKDFLAAGDGHGVLKWAQYGYDGYGTKVVSTQTPPEEIATFFEKARIQGTEIFIEKKIPFVRELAIVGCRSLSGQWISYPAVVSQQKNGVCHEVRGPAEVFGVAPKACMRIEEMIKAVAQELPLEGALAMEVFETEQGDLIVNELAPRVHNSGHYTQDACKVSQFENHLRAILGLTMANPECEPYFGMINILGTREDSAPKDLPRPPVPLHLHWYGKSRVRPGRKMGHVNFSAHTLEEYTALQEKTQNWIRDLKI